MSDPNYNLFDLLRILSKWKKIIIYVTLTVTILSAIISFIVPVYYKSTTIFYPYNLKSFDPRNLDEPAEDIFGDKEDSDRLLLIGTSTFLENKLIEKFDLYKRYDIETTEKYARTKLIQELRDNLKLEKDERGAVEVTVYDEDPKVAADMANETVKLIDQINKAPIIETYSKIVKVFKSQLDEKYDELDSLSNNLRTFKNTLVRKGVNAYFDDIKNADVRITTDIADVIILKEKYQMASLFYDSDMSSLFIVEPANIAEKKSKPVRWIIVAASTFGAFALMSILAIFMEMYKSNELQKNEGRS
jgi:hypothetical protein